MPTLTKLGLTAHEEKVYLMLLSTGPCLAGKISRKTGIHRRTVYDVIERLVEKGLVGYIEENNRKYFEASNPERFKEILKEREYHVDQILPELLQKYNSQKPIQKTSFYRGTRGLKSVFDDQLIQGKEILILGGSAQAYQTLKYYFPHYDKERQHKKIPVKMLFNYETKNKLKKIPLSTIKYLPKEFSTPSATNIYGDTVSIILWGENPYAIVIKDHAIAESYRSYFHLLWKHAQS